MSENCFQKFDLNSLAAEAVYQMSAQSVFARRVHCRFSDDKVDCASLVHIEPPKWLGCEKLPIEVHNTCWVTMAGPLDNVNMSLEDFTELFIIPATNEMGNTLDKIILEAVYCRAMLSGSCFGALTRDSAKAILEKMSGDFPGVDTLACGPRSETELLFSTLFLHVEKSDAGNYHRQEMLLGRVFGVDTYMDSNVDNICDGSSLAWASDSVALATHPRKHQDTPSRAATAVSDVDGLSLRISVWTARERLRLRLEVAAGVSVLDQNKVVVFQD